ncbi:MAG: methyltransferase domain-containing protein, partial [Myxococcales bacterium]|nr:methyltransferase domain-containing protein [Myxococcales bacterium]
GAVAALFGTSLPLTAHYAIPPDRRAGARLSYLYVGNIVGSTAGSLATGFFLLDILTLRELSVLLAILGIFVSGALILAAPARGFRRVTTVAALTLIAAQIFLSSHDLYDRVYEKLLYRGDLSPSKGFAQIVENKSGVVSVSPSGTVYGNGSYDGVFNTDPDPARDVNRVLRAYLVSAFHERPANILMIGLGSGSWLQVLANYPDVKNITVVELNPGYVEVVRRSPEVVSALEHSKVDMVVDDGRRFLNRTDQKYDVIIQNTIVYWRSHATLLLSQEYLELTRSRLREGGVVYYNTTSSTASQRTGASIFPFAWRYQNMLIVSDSPIEINRERWGDRLGSWTIDGLPVLNSDVGADEIEQMLNRERWRGEPTWEGREAILARTRDAPIIRDDTMATEWWAFDTFP